MRALITIGSGPSGLVPTLGPDTVAGKGLEGATGRVFAGPSSEVEPWECIRRVMASSAPSAFRIAAVRRAAAINEPARTRNRTAPNRVAESSTGVCFAGSLLLLFHDQGALDVSGNKRLSEAGRSGAAAGTRRQGSIRRRADFQSPQPGQEQSSGP